MDLTITPRPDRQTSAGGADGGAAPLPAPSRRLLLLGVGTLGAGLALGTGAADAVGPTLRKGDRGSAVTTLQNRLNALRYWCGTPDGSFGHLTQQAVFAVQKAHGLVRDGVVGPVTEAAVASGYRPAPVAGGDHVEVHVGSQLLLFVRGGATVMVLNTSTGNGEPYDYKGHEYIAHTPPGDFAVWYTDGSGWRDGDLGEMWRPMFYSGDYAIHGSASIPPWPASHGCARVSTAAMDMIWAEGMLQMGGRVLVV